MLLKKQLYSLNPLFVLTVIVNILIPKAGIKVSGIPITLGMVLFFLLLVQFVIESIYANKMLFGRKELLVMGCMVFWISRLVIALSMGASASEVLPYMAVLGIYPAMFLVVPHYVKSREQVKALIFIFEICIIAVMLYAFMQYVFGIGTIDIPGITVNLSDYREHPDSWWLAKYNGFGDMVKTVSTYQNGNLLGVSLVLFFPIIFANAERKKIYQVVLFMMFVGTCFLTGSRSVYFGVIVYVVIYGVRYILKRYVEKERLQAILGIGLLGIAGIAVILESGAVDGLIQRLLSSLNWNTLKSATGRTDSAKLYFEWIKSEGGLENWLLGSIGVLHRGGGYEMTYVCVLVTGGLIGLFVFLLPFMLYFKKMKPHAFDRNDWVRVAFFDGIITYLITAIIEGGYWLPPTAMNVWLVLALAYIMAEFEGEKNEGKN